MPNSFADLNDYAANSGLEYTDSRPAGVIFNKPVSLVTDVQLDITSQTVLVSPAIEILEVINYATANVRFQIEIKTSSVNPLTGSSIQWASTPGGTTITQLGDVYTLSGIHSKADWDVVRAFNWLLPSNYATKKLWYLNVSIIYFSEELGQDVVVDWNAFDSDYYYLAALESISTMAIPGAKRYRQTSSAMAMTSYLESDWGTERRAIAHLTASFSVFVSPLDIDFARASLVSTNSLSATAYRKRVMAPKTISAISTVYANPVVYHQINNFIGVSRNWLSNQANQIFATSTPNFDDDGYTGATYSVTLSVASGTIGTSAASSSSYNFMGNKAAVNAVFATLYYYPNKDSSSSTTMTLSMTRNSVALASHSVNLIYAGVGSIPVVIYTLQGTQVSDTLGDLTETMTWTPSLLEKKYGKFDFILVGGGARGATGTYGYTSVTKGKGARGGGAGTYTVVYNQPISLSSYTFEVGCTGGLGGTTTGLGYSAAGGSGGSGPHNGLPAGGSASGYTSGTAGGDPECGGGGAGDAGAGGNGSSGAGGAGGAASVLPFGGYAGQGGQGGHGYTLTGGTNNGRRGTTAPYPGSGGGGGGGYGGPAPGGGGGVGETTGANGIPGAVIIRTYS